LIGGDRDGNPHVVADSLRLALDRASKLLLLDYLEQLNSLGAELSISNELAQVSDDVMELARKSGDRTRRAPTSRIDARSPAFMRGSQPPTFVWPVRRRPDRLRSTGKPIPDPESFRTDLLLLEQSLAGENKIEPAGGGGLLRLIRAVETFGFHLATLDLRQTPGKRCE